jgi:hypothetical protein
MRVVRITVATRTYNGDGASFPNLQVGKVGLPPLEQADDSQEQKTIFHITFFICHFSSAFLHCQSL